MSARWERIGPPDCPLFYRRELLDTRPLKLMIHRFVPDATDRDPHDHPRSFVTLILRGGYDDITVCPECRSLSPHLPLFSPPPHCRTCSDSGRIVERLRAPAIRFRRAEHAHLTNVHPDGATTLVAMGPLARAWGFVRDGRWWPWREYEERYGLGPRCEDER